MASGESGKAPPSDAIAFILVCFSCGIFLRMCMKWTRIPYTAMLLVGGVFALGNGRGACWVVVVVVGVIHAFDLFILSLCRHVVTKQSKNSAFDSRPFLPGAWRVAVAVASVQLFCP